MPLFIPGLYSYYQNIGIFFTISKIGAILIPHNWRLARPELEFIIKDSGSRLLIFEQSLCINFPRRQAGKFKS